MIRYVIAAVDDALALSEQLLGPLATLPAMQPGDSVRVTMRDDGGFDVVRTVKFGMSPERDVLWVDAPEQENDR